MNTSSLGIEWVVDNGKINVRAGQCDSLSLRDLSGSVTVDGRELSLTDAKIISCEEKETSSNERICDVTFSFPDQGIGWKWKIRQADNSIELSAVLHNKTQSEVSVSDWNVLHACSAEGGIINLANNPHQVRFFGWRGWNTRVERFAGSESTHDSGAFCHMFDPDSHITLLCGFVTLDRMQGEHHACYIRGPGVTEYRATCTFGEFAIKPNNELKSETLRVGYHDDPNVALEFWADQLYDTYQPSFEGTLDVCVGGGAWIDSFTNREKSTADLLIGLAKATRERLKGFDINTIGCFPHGIFKDGLPGNWLTFEDAPGFEGGYREVFKKVCDMGFNLKSWFSPFWFFEEAEGVLEENRGNLLKDKNGEPITREYTWEFDRDSDPNDNRKLTMYYLDGTHPKTKEYLTKIFKSYREMGIRGYMLDFLAIRPEAKLYDDTLLPVEAGRRILEVIREAVTRDTHIQTAVSSTPGFIGCINAARVGRDYGEGRPMYPYHNWRNATYCAHDQHFANEHSFIQNAAANWFTHRKTYVNDLNVLTIDKPVPLEQARISTTMFGLSGGSPVALGDDIRNIDEERLRMLKKCFPRTQGVPVPADLFDNVAPESYCHILKKEIQTKWDSYIVVAVFNTNDEPCRDELNFAKLDLKQNTGYRLFEFWNEEYVGTYRESFSCRIPAHSCRVYRLSEARDYPWLLSTDMHLEQGNVEVESLQWNEKELILQGTARRPQGENGNLFFLLPRSGFLKLINHDRINAMKEVIDMHSVMRLPIKFKSNCEKFELCFEKMDTDCVSRPGWLPYSTEKEWLEYVRDKKAVYANVPENRVIE